VRCWLYGWIHRSHLRRDTCPYTCTHCCAHRSADCAADFVAYRAADCSPDCKPHHFADICPDLLTNGCTFGEPYRISHLGTYL